MKLTPTELHRQMRKAQCVAIAMWLAGDPKYPAMRKRADILKAMVRRTRQ